MGKTILLVPITIFGMVSVCVGEVSTRICEANGQTLFDGRDIMVGTKLTIIVSSDVNEPWRDGPETDGGSLAIEDVHWDYGVLSARDYNDGDYEGSHFPAAGNQARVCMWDESGIKGFDMYTDSFNVEAGDWFIIDYNATGVGICEVAFYDHTISWDYPVYYLTFSHVPARDFNKDTKVDFRDYAVLASYWQQMNCGDVNDCKGADLDIDGKVDVNDLMLFSEYWLQRTEYNERTRDFNRDTIVNFSDFALLVSYWQAGDCKNPDWCEETDLNLDGDVNAGDLMFFCNHWLERTEWPPPPPNP